MDAFTFDRLTRLVAVARSRRRLGTAIIGAAAGLLGLTEAVAAPCPKGRKRCRKRCIPRRQCCTSGNCRPKGSGKVCRRGRCVCPASRKRCRKRCIPKAACCGGCPPGLICKQGTCCLGTSAAVNAALAAAGPAVIRLCPGTTYLGSFTIGRDVAIIGSGASSTILNGGDVGIVVQVQSGVTASLHDLQITMGNSGGGGGVFNEGELTLARCLVTDNRSDTLGGGIYNFSTGGTVVLISTTVTNNMAHNGGGIGNSGGFVLLRGATVVSGNTVTAAGGGINSGGTVSRVILQDATLVTDNESPLSDQNSGGGIFNAANAPAILLLDAAQVIGNRPNDCTGPGCPP